MIVEAPIGKGALRAEALARRSALSPDARAAAARRIADEGRRLIRPGEAVALYAPVRGELDPALLAESLARAGHRVCLPVVTGRGEPLAFRRWMPGEPLVPGFARIPEPLPDAPMVVPDLLFLPLAAFDRALHRLGYGAGFYDRTLEALRRRAPVRAYGLAFSVQEVERVPAEPHDAALDGILTETEFLSRAV